jgi:hypothetical protein
MLRGVVLLVLVGCAAVAQAWPSLQRTEFEFEPIKDSKDESESGGWRTWNAVVSWLRPATNYVTQHLPDKTPTEFANDVRETAVDLRDRAADHPVVQGVSRVVRPVGQWFRNTANRLSETSFRDMYNGAVNSVRRADETVAQWINRRNAEQQLEQYNYGVADGVEQVLH